MILAAIKKEHALDEDPKLDGLQFEVTDLRVLTYEDETRGKLTTFLAKIHPDGSYGTEAVYRALSSEIRRRNNNEERPTTVEELLERKAVSCSDLKNILMRMKPMSMYKTLWKDKARPDLSAGQVGVWKEKRIESAWEQYFVERENPGPALRAVQRVLVAELAALKAQDYSGQMWQMIGEIISRVGPQKQPYDEDYIAAMVLWEVHGGEQQLPPADPQSAGGPA